MLSSIEINYLSYRVVPLIQNGNSLAIQNKPLLVEPVSPISTNIGYNSNNPNTNRDIIKHNNPNKNVSANFKEVFENELAKTKRIGIKI